MQFTDRTCSGGGSDKSCFYHFMKTERYKKNTYHSHCFKHTKDRRFQMLSFCTDSGKQPDFFIRQTCCICTQSKQDDIFLSFYFKQYQSSLSWFCNRFEKQQRQIHPNQYKTIYFKSRCTCQIPLPLPESSFQKGAADQRRYA